MPHEARADRLDEVAALRQAQEALGRTRTQIDRHGRRRAIDPATRARMEDALARAAQAAEAAPDAGRDQRRAPPPRCSP